MKWSEEFSTGLDDLDHHHQMLFKMVGDYREALDEGRGELVYDLFLRSVSRYAQSHFGLEEECMILYECPAAKANAAAHAQFAETVTTYIDRYAQNGFKREDALSIVGLLERWLIDHVSRLDAKLRPFVEGRGRPTS